MTEEEYLKAWEEILRPFNVELSFGSRGRFRYFSCPNPPIEIDVSETLTPDQRRSIVERAKAMVPVWKAMLTRK